MRQWKWLNVSEAATGGVLHDKVFLEITQNSQETPVPESFFNVFSCEFCKFPKNTSGRLLLMLENKATKLLDYLQKRWIGKLENFTEESNAQIRKLLIGAIFEIRNTENIQNQFIGLYSSTIIQTSRYLEILYVVGICEQRTLLSGPICAYC